MARTEALTEPPTSETASTAPGARLKRRRSRRLTGIGVLLLVLLASAVLSVAVGAKTIPLADVWSGLIGPGGTENDLIIHPRSGGKIVLAGVASQLDQAEAFLGPDGGSMRRKGAVVSDVLGVDLVG